jgi:hypothetical protein
MGRTMKPIDKSSLTSEEFAMYSHSKLKLKRAVEDMHELAELPPFSFDKTGKRSELAGELLQDINQHLLDVDEEDFITDRYKPLADIKTKYESEINQAREIRDSAPKLGLALKKWFEDNNLRMDEAIAYFYGVD